MTNTQQALLTEAKTEAAALKAKALQAWRRYSETEERFYLQAAELYEESLEEVLDEVKALSN